MANVHVLESQDWGTHYDPGPDQDVATVLASAFNDTEDYILLWRASLAADNAINPSEYYWSVPDSAAAGALKIADIECDAAGAGALTVGHTQAKMDRVTVAAGNNNWVFRLGQVYPHYADLSMVAFNLTEWTENTDFWWNKTAAANTGLTTSYQDFATVTATLTADHEYLVIAWYYLDLSQTTYSPVLAIRDGTTELHTPQQSEGEDTGDFRSEVVMAHVTGDGASHTINASAKSTAAAHNHNQSALLIIDLTAVGGLVTSGNDLSTNTGSTWNEVASLSGASGNAIVLAHLMGTANAGKARLQDDGSSDPGEPVNTEQMWNTGTDVWSWPYFSYIDVQGDLDLDVYPPGDNQTYTDGLIAAIPVSGSFGPGSVSTSLDGMGALRAMCTAKGVTADLDFVGSLNALAGTSKKDAIGALIALGATKKSVVGAINELAGTTGKELEGAIQAWAASGNF